MNENSENECRICFEEETEDNIFINPCLCRGTSKNVHINCLNEWRLTSDNIACRYQCSECKYYYKFTTLYPRNNHNKLKFSFLLLSSWVYMTSFVIWMVVNISLPYPEKDKLLDASVLDSLYPNTTYYYSFKENILSNYLVLYYLILYNTILYYEGLAFYTIIGIYLLNRINGKIRYLNNLGWRLIYYLFFPFKFKVFYLLSMWGDVSGHSLYLTLLALGLTESTTYFILGSVHNETIDKMEKNNVEYILNYEGSEDEGSEDEEEVVEVENLAHFDRINIVD